MRVWLTVGLLMLPLTVSWAQDASLLQSAVELRTLMGQRATEQETLKVLTLENLRLRQQLTAIAAKCP